MTSTIRAVVGLLCAVGLALAAPVTAVAGQASQPAAHAGVELQRGYQGPFATFEQCHAENVRWGRTHVVNECFYWGGSGAPRGWYFYVFGPRG
ncbi:hypothetical protein GL263_25775 [Streptomyces durbertensis]|uniref:Secreted protein n=2 Tax=Streptomyces durbertensis TaxID=2448886 RepID=A0ABR6EQS3_9ACTN|nr:hypothetical protein [Streptomyces durbertensis]